MRCLLFTLPEQISEILNTIKNIEFVDYIDIAVVSVLFYYLYKFVRDRRAGKLAIGVALLFALRIVSSFANMYVLQFLLQNIFQVGIITLVILFQPEIRSVLEKVGATPLNLKGIKNITEARDSSAITAVIDQVTSAVCDLAETKTGALIVFERTTKLGDMILTGTIIDAYPNAPLIKNIFFNKAPMHDGALIIRNMRLHAAGCFLPLSNNPDIIKDLGTRHRAGIGMSENSDAVVVIVSEETGVISTAVEGVLERNYNAESLAAFLKLQLLGDEETEKKMFSFIGHIKDIKDQDKKQNDKR